ncbi:hypothetical [Yersinia pestis KIM10+]|uniref:Uncharacterized protein n=1 Tax=Yersinia pestis TaxID=632 RepID=Q8CLE7_YERPE|nr:hypothetical [Yersinia pestis KIM10+]
MLFINIILAEIKEQDIPFLLDVVVVLATMPMTWV